MKRFLLVPVLFMCMSMHSPSQDSIPPAVKMKAQIETDKQIDSIYSHAQISPLVDAMKYNFRELRSHMDSLNALSIYWQHKLDSGAQARDSLTYELIKSNIENRTLRAENAKYQKWRDIAERIPNIIMLFIVVVAATLFSQGLINGFKKLKHEK